MNLTDTHTHLFLPEFDNDREAMMQRAIRAGVKAMLLPNIDESTLEPMLAMCRVYPEQCKPMLGLHPGSVDNHIPTFLERFHPLLSEHAFVAIGECGLDLFWRKDNLNMQQEVLLAQCLLALHYDLPLVLHSRDAFFETLAVIEKANGMVPGKTLRGVFHCFTGNAEQAALAVELGFYLGIGGVVTYKNSDLKNHIPYIEPNRLLLETDAPYLPPVPYRGKRNESAHLLEIANALAQILRKPVHEVAAVTTRNASTLFSRS